jgi:hypothetical protein
MTSSLRTVPELVSSFYFAFECVSIGAQTYRLHSSVGRHLSVPRAWSRLAVLQSLVSIKGAPQRHPSLSERDSAA